MAARLRFKHLSGAGEPTRASGAESCRGVYSRYGTGFCNRSVRMAGTDDAEAAVRELVYGEGAAVRSGVEIALVEAHAVERSQLPG